MLLLVVDMKTNNIVPIVQLDGYTRCAWIIHKYMKSRNYGSVRGRRHTFKIYDRYGRVRYRGNAIFPDTANFGALLRPLLDFGACHGCNEIAYKTNGKYQKVSIPVAFRFVQFCGIGASVSGFLDMYGLNDLTECNAEQVETYIKYLIEP